MKTVIVSSNTCWSLYNFRAALIRALVERGDRVIALAPRDRYRDRLASLGCNVQHLELDNKGNNPWRDGRTLLAYFSTYRRIRPAVALHFTIKPVLYGAIAARSLGIPCVSTITGLGTAFIHHTPLTRLIEFLYRFSQSWPSRIFLQNSDDLRLFQQRRLANPVRTERLPGSGIDLARFAPVPFPRNCAPIFLLSGRLIWHKGVREFVEAARRVKSRRENVRFQLLGPLGVANRTAISTNELQHWVQEGVIEYLGETDDVRPRITAAHCVVLPSYREGLPRALMEAAAMGRPIITADSPGCREVVDDGESGYLCKPRDVGSLAEAMERILNLPESALRNMGLHGRAKMVNEFDERSVVERYLSAIVEASSIG